MSAIVERAAPRRHAPSADDLIIGLSDRLYVAMIVLVVAMMFLLSEMALTNLGLGYAEGGGSPLEKIHPATYLAFLTLLFMGARHGNPLRLFDVIVSYPGLTVFLLSWLSLFGWVTFVRKTPFSPLIDTFLAAIAVFLLLQDLKGSTLRKIALMIHAILIVNAMLGLYEYISGWRLTPYAIGSIVIDTDWRSTAILGHPLANASTTGSYIVALALGGGRDLPRPLRPAIFGLQLLAMIAFGGRSSLVTALMVVGCVMAWRFVAILRGRRFDRLAVALVFLMAPLAVAAIAGAFMAGFFDQFILRFSDDLGSAKARVIMLSFFQIVPTWDIIIGPDPAYMSSLQSLEGIEFGIESFWVGFIFAHGAIMATLFFIGLGAFCWQLVRKTRPETTMLLIFFFLVASTSVSLSVKTLSFAMFVSLAMVMLRADPPKSARARR